MKVVAFVPIRLNSKRVVGKNLKMLGDKPLLQYILDTLTSTPAVDEVYVYCSQEEVIPLLPQGVKFLKRDESLDRDETLGQEIYDAFTKEVDADVYVLGARENINQQAQHLFSVLRDADKQSYDQIYAPLPSKEGVGLALYNRMIRAAAHTIINLRQGRNG